MSKSRERAAGTSALALSAAVLAASAGLASAAFGIANGAAFHSLAAADLPSAVIPFSFGFVGLLVASRQRRNPTGWLFLFIAVIAGLQGTADGYARVALVSHPGLPGGIWALWLDSWLLIPIFPAGAIPLLLLVFPDGRLPSRRWRPVAVTAVVVTSVFIVLGALAPGPMQTETNFATPANPIGLPVNGTLLAALNSIWVLWSVALVVLVAAAASLLVRMRRSRGDQRQQLKWIAYAVIVSACVIAALTGASIFSPALNTANDVSAALGLGVAVPVAAGIAIFKHRLYDIDIVISRTLVYGALAAFITIVYVGIVVGIGSLIGSGGKPNLGLSIFATAVVAVGFQPVRVRLEKVANRLVYGKRATPYEVLSEFSERVAETYAGEEVLHRMARVLADGTGAEHAAVWLRAVDRLHAAAIWPETTDGMSSLTVMGQLLPVIPDADRAVAVRHQGELLGALSVSKRKGESLTPIEEKLLDDLANQAGLVLKNVGLTADLQRRLEELRASRQRLVAAQDHERRRLERNLHDGAQQNLVAIKVKLGLAEMMTAKDPQQARDLIAGLKADTDQALETLRDLARGIYPPLLADQGLAAALQAQARKATVPVTIEGDGVGRYPQEVEAAVYFCVLEALQNVQKYAGASSAVVKLSEFEGHLQFEVNDDGRGFDGTRVVHGAGLTNMDDRLDALGGKLAITSEPGHFTRVCGSVPLPTARAMV
jgi:signal transduction histidine kinase